MTNNKQDCRKAVAQLSGYLYGEFVPGDTCWLKRHIKDCPSCLSVLNRLRHAIELCRAFVAARQRNGFPRSAKEKLLRVYADLLLVARAMSEGENARRISRSG